MSEHPTDNHFPVDDSGPAANPTAPGDSVPEPQTALPDGSLEPPVDADDTQPRPAAGEDASIDTRLAAEEPPVDPQDDTAPRPPALPPAARPTLLLAVVVLSALCLCVMLVGVAGFAGYRDGLATNDARITQTLATGIAEQYALGVEDLQNQRFELAIARFGWIGTLQPAPDYLRDSPQLLALASTMNAYTSTPTVTPTPTIPPTQPVTPTPTVSPTAPVEASSTPSGSDPARLYDEAYNAMIVNDYETAIEWLDSLIALDPTHRPQEVRAMLLEALTLQGRAYLRGQNEDGEDMLARGVLLIYRADDIGQVEPPSLLYEADFAERYLNARNYVNGGNYQAAIPILQRLCEENCAWAYRGISVESLLARAQSGQ
jgi:tetratricopeptide (TPR) repeat protein